jgi:hypothetical protein
MAILPFTIEVPGGQPVTIYAEPANINYFINGTLDADDVDGVTNSQTQVSSHTRERYPGDPTPVNVSGGTREYLVDPTRKSGNGLPGKSFVLAALDEDGQVLEKRAFTYKGRWIDLHAFLMAEASFDLFAYNSTGTRSTIRATVAP